MKRCEFDCNYLDENGECEAMETECIEDMCESWKCCQSCSRTEECEDVRM